MLLDIRETIRSSKVLKYSIITLIAIPFVLVGIGSYFSGGSSPTVAKVDGEEITQEQLERAVAQQRQQLARMFGGNLPEVFSNDEMLRQQALDGLISQKVMENTAIEEKFAISDQSLARVIMSIPAFQGENGNFDSATYEQVLRSQGMTPPTFEASLRNDTALQQFREGVALTAFELPSERERQRALRDQQRVIEGLRLDREQAREDIEIEEDAIQAHYDEDADNFMYPERVKIDYVLLSASELADGLDISEEQARDYYEDNSANYILPEQRSASHILLQVDTDDESAVADAQATLAEARERIEAGESFADLAAELSDDIGSASNGGSLGVVTRGLMAPELEDTLYALDGEGSLSEPVVTDFGVHLVKLDDIVPGQVEDFEEVKDEIISMLQENEADREYRDILDQMTELAFDEPDSLEPVADATGLEIRSSDWLDSDNLAAQDGILADPAILRTALSAEVREDRLNSEPVSVGDRDRVVLRVTESEGPRQKSLEDVREEISLTLKNERAGELLDEQVADIESSLAEGTAIGELVEAYEVAEAIEEVALTRGSDQPAALLNDVFAISKPEADAATISAVTLDDGDRVVYRLTEVITPESDGELPDNASAIEQRGDIEFQALLDALRESSKVSLE